jgi:hypothetical protein
MPTSIAPIPAKTAITQSGGPITEFFRLRWEEIRTALGLTPTVANPGPSAVQAAALVTTAIYTVPAGAGGQYLVSWSLQRTQIDGAASSLQATIGWTQDSIAKTHVGRLMNTDSLAADPTDPPIPISADQASDITIAIAYTSTTPGTMKYTYTPVAQRLA